MRKFGLTLLILVLMAGSSWVTIVVIQTMDNASTMRAWEDQTLNSYVDGAVRQYWPVFDEYQVEWMTKKVLATMETKDRLDLLQMIYAGQSQEATRATVLYVAAYSERGRLD